MRRRTLLQKDLQKGQLLGYQRSSGTSIERANLCQPGRGNPWNTSTAVSNLSPDSMRERTNKNTNMDNNTRSKTWMRTVDGNRRCKESLASSPNYTDFNYTKFTLWLAVSDTPPVQPGFGQCTLQPRNRKPCDTIIKHCGGKINLRSHLIAPHKPW